MLRWLEKKRKYSIIFLILIAVEIFYFSSKSLAPGPEVFSLLSIIYHFCVFFLFGFFLIISLTQKRKIKIKYLLFAVFISVIYAILDELHQIFVPFRDASLEDFLTDSAGIFFSAIIYMVSKKNWACLKL